MNPVQLAAESIGDVIEHWGFRKALGRTWAILFLVGTPQSANEIGERLGMSAGTTSTTLSELQRWGVVRRVWKPGERKEFFEAETDFWKMISKVVAERELFLATSVRERLELALSEARKTSGPGSRELVERITRLLEFARVAERVVTSFVRSQSVDFSLFSNLLTLSQSNKDGKRAGRS